MIAAESFPETLHVAIRPSRTAAWTIAAVAALTLLMLAVAAIPGPVRWLGILGALVGSIRALREIRRQDVIDLVLNARGHWLLGAIPARLAPARLLSPTLVLPWLVVLRFEVKGARRTLILTPECTSPDALRWLRVALRFPRGR